MLCIHHNSRRDSRPRLSCRATARPGALMHKATMRKLIMCKLIAILSLISLTSLAAWAQAAPAKKTPAAKPPATTSAGPTAVIDTAAGKMTCKLFPDKAPLGVANFIGLAEGTKDWTNPVSHAKKHGVPLYDGTIFHRVIPNFMIQGGDPAGTGMGDPGYSLKNGEIVAGLNFDRPGRLAYANSGSPDSSGSQFFITEVPYPSLNGKYIIFGQCDQPSVELVKKIARMARDPRNDRPLNPVRLTHVSIVKAGATTGATSAAKKKPPVKFLGPPVKKPPSIP